MTSIGALLKEARAKKAVTLEDVQSKTKIHPRVLQLLEEDKFEKLPSPLFVKSFLKSYAEFLEIQPDELLSVYEKEKQKEPEQVLFIRPADPGAGQKTNPAYLILGVLMAVLIGLVLFGHPAKWAKAWFPKPSASKPAVRPHKTIPVKMHKDEIRQVVPVAPEKPSATVGPEWINSVVQGSFPKISRQKPLLLEVKALDAVWIHVSGDGAVLYQGILKKGTSQQWSGKDLLEIWTGNASSMAVTINHVALGSPGKGVAKKMAVTHEGIRLLTAIER